MASNRHLRWWSPPVWFVGEQTVGRVIVCPWSGEQVVALPSVSDVCWSCLSLVVPVGADTGAKPPATLVGVGLHRRLPSSVMSSSLGVTLPCRALLPVLGLATVVRDSPARPCSRWSRHLMLAWSRTTEMAHPFPPLIDRWMLRRSYCVCVWRLTSMCGRVSAAERLMWSIVRTAPNQSDGLRVLIV